jgi:hypothetical protein
MEITFVPFVEERVSPPESFALKGKVQPSTTPNTMTVIVSSEAKASLKPFLKMVPDTTVRLKCPDGTFHAATFMQWYGNHGLFFIEDDCPIHEGVTIAAWILDFPAMIEVLF